MQTLNVFNFFKTIGIDNTTLIVIGVAILFLAAFPAAIAASKNYSGWGYYFFGVICWPIATMTACLLRPKDDKTDLSLDAVAVISEIKKLQKNINKESQPAAEPVETAAAKEYVKTEADSKKLEKIALCNHENRNCYMIYSGKSICARRDLCDKCAEKLRQEGYDLKNAE